MTEILTDNFKGVGADPDALQLVHAFLGERKVKGSNPCRSHP